MADPGLVPRSLDQSSLSEIPTSSVAAQGLPHHPQVSLGQRQFQNFRETHAKSLGSLVVVIGSHRGRAEALVFTLAHHHPGVHPYSLQNVRGPSPGLSRAPGWCVPGGLSPLQLHGTHRVPITSLQPTQQPSSSFETPG